MVDIMSLYLLIIPALAICFGIFGSFSLWNKNSFFGHTFSHSLLLPLSIALLANSMKNEVILISTIVFAVIFVIIFNFFINKANIYYSNDTVLIIVSFFCTALAFFINDIKSNKIDVMSYISGDILFINKMDIIVFYVITICLLLFIFKFHKILILQSISYELAISKNKKINIINTVFLIMQAIFIAIGARAIGVLLISATLLMPSILARLYANNPIQMILLSIIYGFVVMFFGAFFSVLFNIQFTSIIIMIYCILLAIMYIIKLCLTK